MREKEARRSAFVLRVWQDENGRTWGQIQEPASGWQRPFDGVDEMCRLLLAQMSGQPLETAVASQTTAPKQT